MFAASQAAGSRKLNLHPTPTLPETLRQRRQRLAEQIDFPALLWSGAPAPRNFRANAYPFRASSHFLYFAGLPLENAAIWLEAGRLELYVNPSTPADALWHGAMPTLDELAVQIGADAVHPLSELPTQLGEIATIPLPQANSPRKAELTGKNRELALAIGQVRLCHDLAGLAEMRHAAAVTVQAHMAGMRATPQAQTEAQVRAAMEAVLTGANMSPAYNSIITVHGEVLHNHVYHHPLQPSDLLLADLGAETAQGWAADVTRTWPVSGRFSPSQRAIYDLVLGTHDACIAMIRPGVEYREVHLQAAQVLAEGLVDLGILRGQPTELVERDAHALFFPHGIGHLLGLDVHDMEDLGDLVGYAPGRERSHRFGLCYLRLDRPLEADMVVTIEPGFYQVPALLTNPTQRDKYQDCVDWERLAEFADVRGIRIEDDVWVTATGAEVLTAALPTAAAEIEALVWG